MNDAPASPRIPACRSDPALFKQAVFEADPAERLRLLRWFDDIAICELVRLGIFGGQEILREASEFYSKFVMQAPTEIRWEIYREVKGFIENVETVHAFALLPFIQYDAENGLVSSAVIDAVSLGRPPDGDPMYVPQAICRMIDEGRIENRGAAFGGLLHLGDPRICRLIWSLKDHLDIEEARQATRCYTGFTSKSVVEFYLDWLEGMDADDQDSLFGVVASGLVLLARGASVPLVTTGVRPIPSLGVDRETWRESVAPIPIEDFVRQIAPRLYALERTEPGPKVMPQVLAEWRLPTAESPPARLRM